MLKGYVAQKEANLYFVQKKKHTDQFCCYLLVLIMSWSGFDAVFTLSVTTGSKKQNKKWQKEFKRFFLCGMCVRAHACVWSHRFLSSHGCHAAKTHRSLYIKFLRLTRHTAVNQSVTGRAANVSLFLTVRKGKKKLLMVRQTCQKKKK